jgi:tetratricopeptide (TPR) repeat protein
VDETLTPFGRACIERGWSKPSTFIPAFQATAELVGEQVTITDRQFRRWRQPNPPRPHPPAWRVLHAMFGMNPTDLGFPGPAPSTTVDAPHALPKEVNVDRRTFVADSLGVAAGLAVGPRESTGTPDAVGTAHLLELRECLRSLYNLDDAYGGGDVRSLAVRHLRRVRRIINTSSYPDTIGRQLQLLAGETAEQCAWLYYDADDQDTARRYWGEALTTATMLHDGGLQVLVLVSLSMQASYEGRPRDGYDLARAAHSMAVPLGSPVLLSLIAAREARALALMKDQGSARKRLAESMRMVDRSDRGRPAPDWAAFHGHAELDYAQGLLYSDTGHHKAAVPFLRAALAHQDRSYGRNRALYRMTLARGLVQAGEVDEGAAEAVGSLTHLEEVESGRVTRRLAEVRDLLSGVDATSARDAAEELTEYTQQKGTT